jgi:hypothetical protein
MVVLMRGCRIFSGGGRREEEGPYFLKKRSKKLSRLGGRGPIRIGLPARTRKSLLVLVSKKEQSS